MEPIHSFLLIQPHLIDHRRYTTDRGVDIGHFGNTLFQSKAASVM